MSFTTFKIAWRNLWRNRTRTLIALGAITLAQVFVVFMGGLMAGMFDDMLNTLTGPFVGHVRVKTRDWRREHDRADQALVKAEEALKEARDGDDPEAAKKHEELLDKARAAMHEATANMMMFDEFLDDAAVEYEKAEHAYRRANDPAGKARSRAMLGRIAVRNDDLKEARRQFERSRGSFEAAEDNVAADLVVSLIDDPSPVLEAIPERIFKIAKLEKRLKSIDGVTSVSSRILTPVLAFKATDSTAAAEAHAALVAGVDIALETQDGGLLDEFSSGGPLAPGSVVIGKALAKRLDVTAGDKVAIIGQRVDESPVDALFSVAAVIRSDVEMINGQGIAMSYTDAAELLAAEDSAHEVIIRGVDHEKAEELADQVRAIPALIDAEVKPWKQAIPEIAQMLEMKGVMDLIFVIVLFVAAAAGIANTMMMSTFERTREFGMLLGVGCRPFRIVSMVMVESVVLGLMGILIGSAVGMTLVAITSHTGINYAALTGVADKGTDMAFSGLNFSFIMYPKLDPRFVINGMIAVTLTSLLASFFPALSASRLEPMEALRS